MTETEKKIAAKEFAEYWKDKGYEKGESQKFWLSLLLFAEGIGKMLTNIYESKKE